MSENTLAKKELDCITIIKIVMMVLVVLYHSCLTVSGQNWGGYSSNRYNESLSMVAFWLNTVHIQFFTFASGYLFYMIRYEKGGYRSGKADIIRRFKRLMVPYIAVSIFWAIPVKYLAYGFSIQMIIKDFLLATAPSQLWYLPMLFLLFLLFYCFGDLLNKTPIWLSWMIVFGICFGSIYVGTLIPLGVFQVGSALQFAVYFYLGFSYRKLGGRKASICLGCISLILSLFGSAVCFTIQDQYSIIVTLLKPLLSIAGIIAVVEIGKMLECERMLEKPVVKSLTKNSMGIFLFHQQNIFLTMRVFDNTQVPDLIYVLLSFVISFVVAWMISIILMRFKWGKVILGA